MAAARANATREYAAPEPSPPCGIAADQVMDQSARPTASFESIFGLSRLGEANNVTTLCGSDVFTNPTGACSATSSVPWEQC